jgi:hypothetical protein
LGPSARGNWLPRMPLANPDGKTSRSDPKNTGTPSIDGNTGVGVIDGTAVDSRVGSTRAVTASAGPQAASATIIKATINRDLFDTVQTFRFNIIMLRLPVARLELASVLQFLET